MGERKKIDNEECIKIDCSKKQLDFDDIMKFWPFNQYIYEELKEEIEEVVPLVGAGLSQNVVEKEEERYLPWEELLRKCAEKLGSVNQAIIERYIKNGLYEDAAQEIVNIIGKGGLLSFIKKQYDPKKIDSEKMKDNPITVFPYLFDNLILTTNYDKVIEYAFGKVKPLEVLLPTARKRDFVDVIRKKKKTCVLYKFHGDIEKGLEDIILTKDSYDQSYGVRSTSGEKNELETELVRNLSFCLLAHPILFLGCGLKSDRIMDLLVKNKEVHHFAFVACGASNLDDFSEADAAAEAIKKNSELDKKNIRAIFYPRYDRGCIKKLLDELMKYKNQISNDGSYYEVFQVKEEWMHDFILGLNDQRENSKASCVKDHVVIFGGIFSEIREYDKVVRAKKNIDNLDKWLKSNPEAKLFICYDSEDAAVHRAEQTKEDITESSRIEKIKSIRKLPEYFSEESRKRVYLIPITYSLTGYSILADEDLYWNIITHGRSSKGPVLKIMEDLGQSGKSEKSDKIGYMLYALQESKSIMNSKMQQKQVEGNVKNTFDPVFEDLHEFRIAIENMDKLEEVLKTEQQKVKNINN